MIIKEYHLKQQTPMIHFQSFEEGATVRASEVKPKLDRFLIIQLGGENKIPKEWWIDWNNEKKEPNHHALAYKMRITAKGKNDALAHPVTETSKRANGREIGKGIGAYFFDDKNRYKSSYYKNIELTIICFNEQLMKKIDNYIISFFALHNFGLRQNKGFGSFIIGDNLKKSYESAVAQSSGFYLELKSSDTTEILNTINDFWKKIKNGKSKQDGGMYVRSFLMKKYFGHLTSTIHLNEKKAMKTVMQSCGLKLDYDSPNGLAAYDNDRNNKIEKMDLTGESLSSLIRPEYIRGILGFAQYYEFRNVELADDKYKDKKFNIRFDLDGEVIERFSAPVTFKPIIGNEKTDIFINFNNDALEQLEKLCTTSITLKCCRSDKPRHNENQFDREVSNIIDNINRKPFKLTIPQLDTEITYANFLQDFFNKVFNDKNYRIGEIKKRASKIAQIGENKKGKSSIKYELKRGDYK